jgi:hypothetical protein
MFRHETLCRSLFMMNGPLITCPNCGVEIELTEALAATLHANLETAHQAELAQMQAQLRDEAEVRMKVLVDEVEKKVRADTTFEKQVLERQLTDERSRREAAQRVELALRQEKSALENRARELDLEGRAASTPKRSSSKSPSAADSRNSRT